MSRDTASTNLTSECRPSLRRNGAGIGSIPTYWSLGQSAEDAEGGKQVSGGSTQDRDTTDFTGNVNTAKRRGKRRSAIDHPAIWREWYRLEKEWDEKLAESPPSRPMAIRQDVRRGSSALR
jgi:hypothetical protein